MRDPRDIIDNESMSALQWVIIFLTVFMNAMDGFDVQAISVSGRGIREEFGISDTELGFVLSMELIGMAFGSILLGGVADKIGRRAMMLWCMAFMTAGMFLASVSGSVVMLSIWRVITGVGIGGMLSTINATAAEFSNKKQRALCISLMVIGYPIGGIACGMFGQNFLDAGATNWRDMFTYGAILSGILVPLIYFFIPESVHWLTRKQPANVLERVNHSLKKLGHSVVDAMPQLHETTKKSSVLDIFSRKMTPTTLIVAGSYFMMITAFYFVVKWAPTLVADMGFPASSAAGVLTWAFVGGTLGGIVFGLFSIKFNLKRLTLIMLVLTTIGTALFGRSEPDLAILSFWAAFAVFFSNAAISGLYATAARVFPTYLRATGTGFMIGFGRGGAVLAPIVAGVLLDAGISMASIALIMGLNALVAAFILMFLNMRYGDDVEKDAQAGEAKA